jgi:hypothetical protein
MPVPTFRLASATYDDANQVATWGGTTLSFDNNGNMTFDGIRTYMSLYGPEASRADRRSRS